MVCRIIGRSRAGLSLVETLVAVAIVGTLCATLLPMVGKARKSAQQSACVSNLRQIGVGMSMYAGENSQQLPPMSGPDGFWTAYLVPYLSEIKNQNKTVFICPGKVVPLKVANDFASGGRTYGASRLVLGPQSPVATVPPLRINQIASPASVILVADANQVPGNNGNSSFDLNQAPFNGSQKIPAGSDASDVIGTSLSNVDAAPAGAMRFRHGDANIANALMVDGHVEAIRRDALTYGNVYPIWP